MYDADRKRLYELMMTKSLDEFKVELMKLEEGYRKELLNSFEYSHDSLLICALALIDDQKRKSDATKILLEAGADPNKAAIGGRLIFVTVNEVGRLNELS